MLTITEMLDLEDILTPSLPTPKCHISAFMILV